MVAHSERNLASSLKRASTTIENLLKQDKSLPPSDVSILKQATIILNKLGNEVADEVAQRSRRAHERQAQIELHQATVRQYLQANQPADNILEMVAFLHTYSFDTWLAMSLNNQALKDGASWEALLTQMYQNTLNESIRGVSMKAISEDSDPVDLIRLICARVDRSKQSPVIHHLTTRWRERISA